MKRISILVIFLGIVIGVVLIVERRSFRPTFRDGHPQGNEATQSRREVTPGNSVNFTATHPGPAVSPPLSSAAPWKDPAWSKARFDQAYLYSETHYGKALQKLVGWPPERLEALKVTLANNEISMMRAGLPEVAPTTNEERLAVSAAIQAAEESNEKRLKDTMGEDDYAQFSAAVKAEPSRESVEGITNAMRANNVEVSNDTQESILAAYSLAEQQAAVQNTSHHSTSAGNGSETPGDAQQREVFHQILMKEMRPVLNENQLQVFMTVVIEREKEN